jgi:hypothetical protein
MSPRLRKLIGSLVFLAGLAVYIVVVIAVSQGRILDTHPAVQFAFFLVAGLAWVLPAAWLIKWMYEER